MQCNAFAKVLPGVCVCMFLKYLWTILGHLKCYAMKINQFIESASLRSLNWFNSFIARRHKLRHGLNWNWAVFEITITYTIGILGIFLYWGWGKQLGSIHICEILKIFHTFQGDVKEKEVWQREIDGYSKVKTLLRQNYDQHVSIYTHPQLHQWPK